MMKKTYGISQKSVFNSTIVFLLAIFFSQSGYGATIHVKQGGTGDGSSWASAYGGLQDALDAAVSGDEIWVAAGTYNPTYDYGLGIGDRGRHFRMKNGVAIYGGFAGTETLLNQRDIDNNPTILSGDIGVQGDISDNCYHVFYHPSGTNLDSTAILDGFTVTAGNANNSSWPHNQGGGMFNNNAHPALSNCIFKDNSAGAGGGLSNWISSPIVTGCIFIDNSTNVGGGGGIYNYSNNPVMTNCAFFGNSAELGGGGVFNYESNSKLDNCIFSGNSTNNNGGGIYNYSGNPEVINSTLSGNSASRYGGGIYNTSYSIPTVINCIIWNNSAIIAGNEIYENSGSPALIIYNCIVKGGYDLGTNIINSDPLFIDADGVDNTQGTEDDNFHLSIGSPGIDAGTNSVVLKPTDLDGKARISDGDNDGTATVDTGAYEYEYMPIVTYVDANAGGANNGTSWADAYNNLQNAIDNAVNVDQIWVAAGTYKPTKEVGGSGSRYQTFQMTEGVSIYGGFAGTETDLSHREIQNNKTILSGDIGVPGDKSDNCYHVMLNFDMDSTDIIDAFTMTGGNADGPTHFDDVGGGMLNYYCNPTVINCTFTGNSARVYGGGMCNLGSSPTVINCIFTSNLATSNSTDLLGGGMFNWNYCSPTVINCVFTGNSAYDGGGMCNFNDASTVMTNCTFIGNSADQSGGAMFNFDSSPNISNSIFWGNNAGWGNRTEIGNNISTPTFFYCDIEGTLSGGSWPTDIGIDGGGNIDIDPLFIDADGVDNILGTEDDNLRLQVSSPCIDTGDNGAVPAGVTTDMDGGPRALDGDNNASAIVDMGAYELKYVEQTVNPSQTTTLIPNGGSGTATEDAQVTFENTSGTSTTVTATQYDTNLHISEHGYTFMGTTLVVETPLADGDFLATIKIPFSTADLDGLNWRFLNLEYWNGSSWELAILGNTQNSPDYAGLEGDRYEAEDAVIPTLSSDLGDYGVFWNPTEGKGFVWANVDHATDFAAIVLLGDFEPDGDVDLVDFAILAAAWMSDDTPTANWNEDCDLDGSGDIGIDDLVKFTENWLAGK